jgi:hypothetical protein
MALGPADEGIGVVDRSGRRHPDVELGQPGTIAEHPAAIVARAGVHAVYLDHDRKGLGGPGGLPERTAFPLG